MDFTVLIVIAGAILASIYNDRQKRRLANEQSSQEEHHEMEKEIPTPVFPREKQRAMPPVSAQRPQRPHAGEAKSFKQSTAHLKAPVPAQPSIEKHRNASKSAPSKCVEPAPQPTEEFDLRQAVIYSEILTPKFREEE